MSTDGYGFDKNVDDMRIADLKDVLSQRGLSTVGKKADLVARLIEHVEEERSLKRKAEGDDIGAEDESANKKQKTGESEPEGKLQILEDLFEFEFNIFYPIIDSPFSGNF